ncbi:hypothetical protein [Nitrosomonas sp.]|uniref:hypothetical protein n=1 Tax=Nitrosomonas sp. TaxID=42353 RepID=UPI00271B4747|nr:hypothetical protein [Nitrosomonas sp.]MDO8893780.1 hypothetical protein [Nitrosomonas sp.]
MTVYGITDKKIKPINRQIAKEYQRVVGVKVQSVQKMKSTKHNMTGDFFVNRDMSKRKKHSKDCLQQFVRLLTNLVFLTGFFSLTGCAGIHLYNPDKDATASLVKKTSDEINFQAVIEEERKNQAKLLNHELEIVAQAALAMRNTMLRALLENREKPGTLEVESLSEKQERIINDQLSKLIGRGSQSDQESSRILDSLTDWETSKRKMDDSIMLFELEIPTTTAPKCEIGIDSKFEVTSEMINKYKAISSKSEDYINKSLTRYRDSCVKHQKFWEPLANLGGIFSAIAKEEKAANNNLNAQEEEAEKLEVKFKEALDEYNKALKQAETDASETVKKNISQKSNELKDALNTFEKTGVFGKKSAVNHQIESIDLILDVLAEGKLNEEKLNCSEIKNDDKDKEIKAQENCLKAKQRLGVVAQLPSFAGRGATIEALTKLPPVNALLFEKERLMALKEDAEKQIDRTKSKIALLQQKRNAAFDAINRLMLAKQHLDWARKANGNKDLSLSDLYQKSIDESARRHMVIAMTTYLNTFTGPQRMMHEIEHRLIDINHAQALDATETALRLWEVAIKQPINVLATYHASGMKREELAKLIVEAFKAAGLFTIAGGVLN